MQHDLNLVLPPAAMEALAARVAEHLGEQLEAWRCRARVAGQRPAKLGVRCSLRQGRPPQRTFRRGRGPGASG